MKVDVGAWLVCVQVCVCADWECNARDGSEWKEALIAKRLDDEYDGAVGNYDGDDGDDGENEDDNRMWIKRRKKVDDDSILCLIIAHTRHMHTKRFHETSHTHTCQTVSQTSHALTNTHAHSHDYKQHSHTCHTFVQTHRGHVHSRTLTHTHAPHTHTHRRSHTLTRRTHRRH